MTGYATKHAIVGQKVIGKFNRLWDGMGQQAMGQSYQAMLALEQGQQSMRRQQAMGGGAPRPPA